MPYLLLDVQDLAGTVQRQCEGLSQSGDPAEQTARLRKQFGSLVSKLTDTLASSSAASHVPVAPTPAALEEHTVRRVPRRQQRVELRGRAAKQA